MINSSVIVRSPHHFIIFFLFYRRKNLVHFLSLKRYLIEPGFMPLNIVWRCLLKINEVLVSEMILQGSFFLAGLAVG